MGVNSSIEWCDSTWNPVRGCSRVSPGCVNCYAEKVAARFSDQGQPFHLFASRTPKPHWTGKVGIVENHLMDPLKWRKPQRIFVNSMSDLFHEDLPDEAIDRVFAVMALCPQHTFQCLTKRPGRMLRYLNSTYTFRRNSVIDEASRILHDRQEKDIRAISWNLPAWPLPNVWLGVSAENFATWDARVHLLKRTPAAVRFVSYEPALEDLESVDLEEIDWLIVGGESGPGARPFDISWARNTVHQCAAAGVACFVKQLGPQPYDSACDQRDDYWPGEPFKPDCRYGAVKAFPGREKEYALSHILKSRKGGDMSEWPEDIRVRQFPVVCS